MNAQADGFVAYTSAFARGLACEPDFTVDEWADRYMQIPRGPAAEPGPYRTARTPYAREPMRRLSPSDPARRVIVIAASQLMKTQVALNWIGAIIHQAPANALILLPTDGVAKRVSSRIDKTVRCTPVLASRVAKPRARNARNTIDTKEFSGGTGYICTAQSAANLSEVPVRYIYGDEISRWVQNVGGEGDPIRLAENRTSTFGKKAKFYYTSTPTIDGLCAITKLAAEADEYRWHVPCPHCSDAFEWAWERFHYAADFSRVWLTCPHCGAEIDEADKTAAQARGAWVLVRAGNGIDAAFTALAATNAPYGWVSWETLAREYDTAKKEEAAGDHDKMQSFYNTRLARCYQPGDHSITPAALRARAEQWSLGTLRPGVCYVTSAVDVQDNRLEFTAIGWGAGLERWWLDHRVIWGPTAVPPDTGVWAELTRIRATVYTLPGWKPMPISITLIDSGGHSTEDVYAYVARNRGCLAIKGSSVRAGDILQSPTTVDKNARGKNLRWGVKIWKIGTHKAKDWIADRWSRTEGAGCMHFPADLPEAVYDQLCAEVKVRHRVRGRLIADWIKPGGKDNEGLDLLVYNLAAAHVLGLHRKRPAEWAARFESLRLASGDLFADQSQLPAVAAAPVPAVVPATPPPARNISEMIARARQQLGA